MSLSALKVEDELSRNLNAGNYAPGGIYSAVHARVQIKRTAPPPAYTQASLLADMLAAEKFASTPEDREQLRKSNGIGTARTRPEVIRNLLRRGLLVESRDAYGKTFLATSDLARRTLAIMPQALVSVVTTAKLELAFSWIESGRAPVSAIQGNLAKLISKLFGEVKQLRQEDLGGSTRMIQR